MRNANSGGRFEGCMDAFGFGPQGFWGGRDRGEWRRGPRDEGRRRGGRRHGCEFDREDSPGLAMAMAGGGHRGAGRGGFGRDFGDGFDAGRMGGGRGGPGGPGGGRSGGGRRRRLFDQGELQALLLSLIVASARHGYELIREIEAISGGEYAPSPGVVYPALTYMEEAGLIAPVAKEGARKAFEATAEGTAQAASDEARVAELRLRLEQLASARAIVDPAPVRRAMHGLRSAVVERLSRGEPTRETVLAIAEAIDELTRRIEREEG